MRRKHRTFRLLQLETFERPPRSCPTLFSCAACSNPDLSVSSVIHSLNLKRVTANNTTFLEWTTDFSNDATAEVIQDSKFKKLDVRAPKTTCKATVAFVVHGISHLLCVLDGRLSLILLPLWACKSNANVLPFTLQAKRKQRVQHANAMGKQVGHDDEIRCDNRHSVNNQ